MKYLFNQKFMSCSFGVLLAGLLLTTACGSSNNPGGIDPLQIVDGTSSNGVGGNVQLNAIVPYTGPISTPLQQVYSPSQPYWLFLASSFSGFGGYYAAPAAGFITSIGTTTISGVFGSYVTMVHSGHLSSQLFGIQSLNNIHVGDTVQAGQNLGTYFTSGNLGFKVLYDKVPVCPLSFLTPTFQAQFSFATNPCL